MRVVCRPLVVIGRLPHIAGIDREEVRLAGLELLDHAPDQALVFRQAAPQAFDELLEALLAQAFMAASSATGTGGAMANW